jgi:WD40 repeat protein
MSADTIKAFATVAGAGAAAFLVGVAENSLAPTGAAKWALLAASTLVIVGGGVWRAYVVYRRRRPTLAARVWDVEPAPVDAIIRRDLTDQLVAALTQPHATIAVTTGLHGAGGFGKTTLARQVCWHPSIRKRFTGGCVWVTVGEDTSGPAVTSLVREVYHTLHGPGDEIDTVVQPDRAGRLLGQWLDQLRDVLLVIDDVWEPDQLAPFRQGGTHTCTRLVTTRRPRVLTGGVHPMLVDQLTEPEARALLSRGLPRLTTPNLAALVQRTGRWAMLVDLANTRLHDSLRDGEDLNQAAATYVAQLAADGPAALNVGDETSRNQAIEASITASLRRLTPHEQDHYLELGIFAEDTRIPLPILDRLWSAAGLSAGEVRQLCQRLAGLSLVQDYDRDRGLLLHDVFRAYLRRRGRDRLTATNNTLIDAARHLVAQDSDATAWWQLPHHHEYLWEHLCTHLADAGHADELSRLVTDLRWVEARIHRSGPVGIDQDLAHSPDPAAETLRRALRQNAHLLAPIDPPQAWADILIMRLTGIEALQPAIENYRQHLPLRPRLHTIGAPADQPHPALGHVLTGHTSAVVSCAIAAQANLLATTSSDGTARVWDLASGQLRHELVGHTGPVLSCAVAAQANLVVTTSDDHSARVWDLASGQLRHKLVGHTSPVLSCAVAAQADLVVTTSYDGSARVWDLASGQLRHKLVGHTNRVASCAIAAQANVVVTTSNDGTARVWDLASGQLRHKLTGHTDGVVSCAIAAQANLVVTTSDDKTARVWDLASGQLRHELTGHTSPVLSCAVAAQADLVVTTSDDKTARVWDLASGQLRHELTGHTSPVVSCVIAAQANQVVTTSYDGTARIWDLASGQLRHELTGHTSPVLSCAIAAQADLVITTSDDKTARVWDLASGQLRHELTGHTRWVLSCAVAAQANLVITTSNDRTARIWDLASGQLRHKLVGHIGWVVACAVAIEAGLVVTTSNDGTARVWDLASGQLRHELTGHTAAVLSCAVAAQANVVVTTSNDGTARVWDLASGQLRHELTGHTNAVVACAVAAQAGLVITTSHDRTARIWDLASGQLRHELTGHTSAVVACAIAAQAGLIGTTSYDQTARIWDLASGQLRHQLTGHTDSVVACAVAAEAGLIVTTSDDRTARIWDLASGQLRHELPGHTRAVVACAVAADAGLLVTTSLDGTARVWDLTAGTCMTATRVNGSLNACDASPDGLIALAGTAGHYLLSYEPAPANPGKPLPT